MQPQTANRLVPLLSSQAGNCLTLANWEDAGITTISYHLAELLMKPGLSILKNLSNLRLYLPWQKTIVLNALMPSLPNQEDIYNIRSRYDGSLIQIDTPTLLSLITRLQPDRVILPPGISHYFTQLQPNDTSIFPYFSYLEESLALPIKAGTYFIYKQNTSFNVFLDQMNAHQDPIYVLGNFDLSQISRFSSYNKILLESDKPANDGMTGFVYYKNEILNILDKSMSNDQQPIDNNCQCQTCLQKFTRAYLHHLLQQTPLLAQRYLIQHNVHYYKLLHLRTRGI